MSSHYEPPRHSIGDRGGDSVDPRHTSAALDAAAAAQGPAATSGALALAFVAGAVVALLGAVAWAAASIATGYNIGFLAWLIGAATGFTVLRVAKGPVGLFERIFIALFAGAAILMGKYLIFADAWRTAASHHGTSAGWVDGDAISFFVHNFGPGVGFRAIDWLWVALAVIAAFRVSEARQLIRR